MGFGLGLHIGEGVPVGQVLQQIQGDLHTGDVFRQVGGQVEHADARQAAIPKEHLAALLVQGLARRQQGGLGPHPHALEGAQAFLRAFQGREGRAQLCDPVAQGLGQSVAAPLPAVLGRGLTPAGQDAPSAPKALPLGAFQAEAPCLPGQGGHAPIASQGDTQLLAGLAEDLEHSRRLEVPGVDAALAVGAAQQAHGLELLQDAAGRAGFQQGGGQGHVPVVVGGPGVQVGQVAAAVACGQQLLPRLGVALQHHDADGPPLGPLGFGGGLGGHQPRGPGPYDGYLPAFHNKPPCKNGAPQGAFPHCTGSGRDFISILEL